MQGKFIYLDHAATTPLRPEVREAMLPWLGESFGNPSSPHRHGRGARRAVEAARAQVAALIGADPDQITFTSSCTEANNLVLRSAAANGIRIAVSAVEHPSVLRTAKALHAAGREVTITPVDAEGRAALPCVHEGGWPATLDSIMLANNESGVLQPVAARGAESQAMVHTDAAQAAGKIPIDAHGLGVEFLTLSAHKLGGPQGAGALFARSRELLQAQLTGGSQERRMRAGTENVAAIAGFGMACKLAAVELTETAAHLTSLRTLLEEMVLGEIPDSWINGRGTARVPHIVNAGFEGVEGEDIMMALDAKGIAVSTGSACSSGEAEASHVLLAMGQSHTHARASIRMSMGRANTRDEIARAGQILAATIKSLREGGSPT